MRVESDNRVWLNQTIQVSAGHGNALHSTLPKASINCQSLWKSRIDALLIWPSTYTTTPNTTFQGIWSPLTGGKRTQQNRVVIVYIAYHYSRGIWVGWVVASISIIDNPCNVYTTEVWTCDATRKTCNHHQEQRRSQHVGVVECCQLNSRPDIVNSSASQNADGQ